MPKIKEYANDVKSYLLLHKVSNLIVKDFQSSQRLSVPEEYKLIQVSETVLEKYHNTLEKHSNGTCVDAGEFAILSPSFLESLKLTH
ncbi:hypothetical protein [Pseudomonas monteilii]|uniref:hypothetical protein n=1 Tax=Pseudomonas monteilii TaxID=76759 RepID=UPI0004908DDC|nr:hypothetical protein [Pseudomonas monteilii]